MWTYTSTKIISIHLLSVYRHCLKLGLNQRPSDLQSDALPTELYGPTSIYICILIFLNPLYLINVL